MKLLVLACALLVLSGCSQWRSYQCVRDTVSRSEPFQSQADRDDAEALARQQCRERAAGKGN
jgi:uncharacterized lipoprotein